MGSRCLDGGIMDNIAESRLTKTTGAVDAITGSSNPVSSPGLNVSEALRGLCSPALPGDKKTLLAFKKQCDGSRL